jgi:3-isopropylmalate/(R)-2-methylmalate dehydratase small subunit
MEDVKRIVITGRAVPLRGNDIDTDRIIPARYLKTVVFDGLGAHSFEDDRAQLRATGKTHPFDDPRYAEARILVVNRNFGCGSSREHAPQALIRWNLGLQAIIGESFAEIFQGNCVATGTPCAVVDPAAAEALLTAVERDPTLELRVDLQTKTIAAGAARYAFSMPEGARTQFLEGRWDSTAELLAAKDQIRRTASKVPYFDGYKGVQRL